MRSINEALQSIPNKLVAQDVQAGILNNIETFDTHTIMSFQANVREKNSQQEQWQKNETPHK